VRGIERVSVLRQAQPSTARRRRRFRTPTGFSPLSLIVGIGPAVLLFVVFLGVPIVQSLQLSFSDWGGVGSVKWAGLRNYSTIFSNGEVYHSLLTTVEFSLLASASMILVATFLAAAVNAGIRGGSLYRILWFLPVVAPGPAVGVFWSLAFQPGQGVANAFLGALGLGRNHTWLARSDTALYPPVLAAVWAGVGLAFLLILGAMRSIPLDVYEAARIDGASPLKQFWFLTLPLIRPVLITTAMLEVIWNANSFTLLWAMTQGGPGYATSVLPVYVYKQAFAFSEFGSAAAAATLGGAVLLIFGMLMLRASKSQRQAAL
jgi:ABC-type sugar transport system permease subunit